MGDKKRDKFKWSANVLQIQMDFSQEETSRVYLQTISVISLH